MRILPTAALLLCCICASAQGTARRESGKTANNIPASGIIGGGKATGERIRVASEGMANPERGFRFEIKVGLEGKESTESSWPFADYSDDGITMTQAYCYLSDYWDSEISQSKLDALQASFDRARKDGVKFVLRFAYQTDMEQKGGCPSIERILAHIGQLTPIVRKNIDVIYTLQTGWIGAWGEFHSDPNGLDRDSSAVAAVLDATLKMLPGSRSTMMRCMRYRTKAEEYAGEGRLDMSRVGFFNDGTVAGTQDGGTFDHIAYEGDPEFDEATAKSPYFPVDGELFWNSVPDRLSANAINALHRLVKHHYTTFSVVHSNSELDPSRGRIYGSIDSWKATPVSAGMLKAQGLPCDENYFRKNPLPSAYEYIRDHLGYRLELVDAEGGFEGKDFSGKVLIRNVGFARPINPRPVYLVLYNRKGDVYEINTGIDVCRLQPWEEMEIPLAAVLPADAPRGRYKAALWLPDDAESLRYRPEYAVELAWGSARKALDGRLLNCLDL